jgi:hypothetical protein
MNRALEKTLETAMNNGVSVKVVKIRFPLRRISEGEVFRFDNSQHDR